MSKQSHSTLSNANTYVLLVVLKIYVLSLNVLSVFGYQVKILNRCYKEKDSTYYVSLSFKVLLVRHSMTS